MQHISTRTCSELSEWTDCSSVHSSAPFVSDLESPLANGAHMPDGLHQASNSEFRNFSLYERLWATVSGSVPDTMHARALLDCDIGTESTSAGIMTRPVSCSTTSASTPAPPSTSFGGSEQNLFFSSQHNVNYQVCRATVMS